MKRQDIFEKIYWTVVVTVSALTVITAIILALAALLRPMPIVEAEPPTATLDAYITMAAYAEPEPTPEPTPAAPRYALTAAERDVTERTVQAEGGNTEDVEGLMLVSQCILNACERSDARPDEAVVLYQYAPQAEEVNDRVKEAVARVFDLGDAVTDEPILFFYAPRYCESSWHESLGFVAEHGGHRFFKLREDENGL